MKKLIAVLTLLSFMVTCEMGNFPAYAQSLTLPAPGRMLSLSPALNPPILKGLKIDSKNPFKFEFILDRGDENNRHPEQGEGSQGALRSFGFQPQDDRLVKQESTRLIKYFLASLTIPEQDLWVNLSPYEKNRIVPGSFGKTEMGRDLLAEDYMLKQITASLIYPEGETGKKFWKRIYAQAAQKFGTTNIPVNTFNKVWIVPERAVVYENAKARTAYVVEAKLKVMLEEDYLAFSHSVIARSEATKQSLFTNKEIAALPTVARNDTITLGSQIIREIVIPELTKEVNEGSNFAQLRQVYNSLILATWYKKKIKDSILAQVYEGKNKIKGTEYNSSVILKSEAMKQSLKEQPKSLFHQRLLRFARNDTSSDVELIYQRYLQAFKQGAYSYIKEEVDPATQQSVTRKYFSGGTTFDDAAMNASYHSTSDLAVLPETKRSFFIIKVNTVPFDSAMKTGDAEIQEGLSYEEAEEKYLNWKKTKVKFPRGFWTNRTTAINYTLAFLDHNIEGFREERLKSKPNIRKMAELYRKKAFVYKALDSKKYQNDQQAFFYEQGGLKGLMGNPRKFLDKTGSPGALLRLLSSKGEPLEGFVDEDSKDALKPWEIENYEWTEASAGKAILNVLIWHVPGFKEAYEDNKNIKGMADLYRKYVMEYTARDNKKYKNDQQGFFTELGRLESLMNHPPDFLNKTGSPAALMRFMSKAGGLLEGLVNSGDKDALKPWEIEYNYWTEERAAKALVNMLLWYVDGFQEAYDEKNIQKMADLYRQQVMTYTSRDPRKYPNGQTGFYYELGGLKGLMTHERDFLVKTSSPAALLRLAIQHDSHLKGLIDDNNPDALQSYEVEKSDKAMNVDQVDEIIKSWAKGGREKVVLTALDGAVFKFVYMKTPGSNMQHMINVYFNDEKVGYIHFTINYSSQGPYAYADSSFTLFNSTARHLNLYVAIYVEPEIRSSAQGRYRGIGSTLLGLAERFAKEKGASAFYISLISMSYFDNFYKAKGYKILPRRGYYGDGVRAFKELNEDAFARLGITDQAQLALDARPTESGLLRPEYVDYDMRIKELVNPRDEPLVYLQGAAGGGAARLLLSTNASTMYFVDQLGISAGALRSILEKRYPLNPKRPGYVRLYSEHKFKFGFAQASSDAKGVAQDLLIELSALGVSKDSIQVSQESPNGPVTISFEWAYKGGQLRPRKIVYLKADIEENEKYLPFIVQQHPQGINGYYQLASYELVNLAKEYLPNIAKLIVPGGFILMDDRKNDLMPNSNTDFIGSIKSAWLSWKDPFQSFAGQELAKLYKKKLRYYGQAVRPYQVVDSDKEIMKLDILQYYRGIRQLINPLNKALKVFYAGAGADLTNVMAATNAGTFYMVGRYKGCDAVSLRKYLNEYWTGMSLSIQDRERRDRWRRLKRLGGYQTLGSFGERDEIYEYLIIELQSLGLQLKDITVGQEKGAWFIKFKKNDPALGERLVSFYFINVPDLTDPSTYPPALHKVIEDKFDLYFQNAGGLLAENYEKFLPIISRGLLPKGFWIIDNYSYYGIRHSPYTVLKDHFNIEMVKLPAGLLKTEKMFTVGYGKRKDLFQKTGDLVPAGRKDRLETTRWPVSFTQDRQLMRTIIDQWLAGGKRYFDRKTLLSALIPEGSERIMFYAGPQENPQAILLAGKEEKDGKEVVMLYFVESGNDGQGYGRDVTRVFVEHFKGQQIIAMIINENKNWVQFIESLGFVPETGGLFFTKDPFGQAEKTGDAAMTVKEGDVVEQFDPDDPLTVIQVGKVKGFPERRDSNGQLKRLVAVKFGKGRGAGEHVYTEQQFKAKFRKVEQVQRARSRRISIPARPNDLTRLLNKILEFKGPKKSNGRLNQEEWARKIGLTNSMMSKVLKGLQLPQPENFKRMLDSLRPTAEERKRLIDYYLVQDELKSLKSINRFGDVIRRARIEMGWSSDQLAVQIGVDRSAVQVWEKGQSSLGMRWPVFPSDVLISKLADAFKPLKITEEYLRQSLQEAKAHAGTVADAAMAALTKADIPKSVRDMLGIPDEKHISSLGSEFIHFDEDTGASIYLLTITWFDYNGREQIDKLYYRNHLSSMELKVYQALQNRGVTPSFVVDDKRLFQKPAEGKNLDKAFIHDRTAVLSIVRAVGKVLGQLHAAEIIHGDLGFDKDDFEDWGLLKHVFISKTKEGAFRAQLIDFGRGRFDSKQGRLSKIFGFFHYGLEADKNSITKAFDDYLGLEFKRRKNYTQEEFYGAFSAGYEEGLSGNAAMLSGQERPIAREYTDGVERAVLEVLKITGKKAQTKIYRYETRIGDKVVKITQYRNTEGEVVPFLRVGQFIIVDSELFEKLDEQVKNYPFLIQKDISLIKNDPYSNGDLDYYRGWSPYMIGVLSSMIAHADQIRGANFTDFGAGFSGILAVAAEKLGAARIVLIEKDSTYMDQLKRNIGINTLHPSKYVYVLQRFEHMQQMKGLDSHRPTVFVMNLENYGKDREFKAAMDLLKDDFRLGFVSGGLADVVAQVRSSFSDKGIALKAEVITKLSFDGISERSFTTFIVNVAHQVREVHSQRIKDNSQLALDMRPINAGLLGAKYVDYDMRLKEMVNPDNKPLVYIQGAAGGGAARLLLSTNATTMYFIDKYEIDVQELRNLLELNYPLTRETSAQVRFYLARKAYNGFALGDTDPRHIALNFLTELSAIGVAKNNPDGSPNIKISQETVNGPVTISFKWAYKGGTLQERKIVYLMADMKYPNEYMQDILKNHPKGVDGYYQLASYDLLEKAKSYLPKIARHIIPGGFVLVDERLRNSREMFVRNFIEVIKSAGLVWKDPFLSNQGQELARLHDNELRYYGQAVHPYQVGDSAQLTIVAHQEHPILVDGLSIGDLTIGHNGEIISDYGALYCNYCVLYNPSRKIGAIFHVQGGFLRDKENIKKALVEVFQYLKGQEGFRAIIAVPKSDHLSHFAISISDGLNQALSELGVPIENIDHHEAWFKKKVFFDIASKAFYTKRKGRIFRQIKFANSAMVGADVNYYRKGGIDLTKVNADSLLSRYSRDLRGNGVRGDIEFQVDTVMLQELKNIPGFVPIIIDIQPTQDLRGFLTQKDFI